MKIADASRNKAQAEGGCYGIAARSAAPPPILNACGSPAGVHVLLQAGHAQQKEFQEIAVPPMQEDAFILLGSQHKVLGKIGDRVSQFGGSGAAAAYIGAGLPSHWKCEPSDATVLHFHISPAFRQRVEDDSSADISRVDVLWEDDVEVQLGEQLRASLLRGDPLPPLVLESYAVLMLAQRARPRSSVRTDGISDGQVAKIKKLFQAGLAHNFSLEEVAAEARLSAFHFARRFKQSTGVPPYRFLVQLRVEKAKEMLEQTTLPITGIAAKVGYDDPSYFARLFQKEVGVTPSRYRRERRS